MVDTGRNGDRMKAKEKSRELKKKNAIKPKCVYGNLTEKWV
jgi:hypothetical protein